MSLRFNLHADVASLTDLCIMRIIINSDMYIDTIVSHAIAKEVSPKCKWPWLWPAPYLYGIDGTGSVEVR